MKKNRFIMIILLSFMLLFAVIPQVSVKADSKAELLEQALIQQLYATIYQTLQNHYREDFPQFEDVQIIHIETYVTGKSPLNHEEDRKVSATGGATVYNITVQLKAIHHKEIVQISMSNEQNGAKYTVYNIKTSK